MNVHPSRQAAGAAEGLADEETARRRDEVLRRMLNTPPKPHGKGAKAAEKEKPRDARASPGPRSGQKVEKRGEGQ